MEDSFGFDLLLEGTLVAILVKEIEVVYCFEDLNELYNVRAVYFAQDFDFVKSAFFKFRVFFELANMDNFDSYLTIVASVNTFVDFAILSFSNLFMKSVIFNDFDHPLDYKSYRVKLICTYLVCSNVEKYYNHYN